MKTILFSFFLLWYPFCQPPVFIDEAGTDIESRFLLPVGFQRTGAPAHSFAAFLRSLPLKPHGTEVRYYDGTIKPNGGSYIAVVDLPISHRDLEQCADAVIRLRAEYLYREGRYEDINFRFTNGFRAAYSEWRSGKRIVVDGNTVYWQSTTAESTSEASFRKYLNMIFAYAGSASLARDLEAVEWADLRIGDVLVQGGYPGHAQIVVDMAVNPGTGEKIFLLAQSFMPAQEIHVLDNLQGQGLGPWYSANFPGELHTPSWTFRKNSLKRFVE